jgi:GT2 family glycosyltransferase
VVNKIGVVTITYNSAEVIHGFMQSLSAQTHPSFITYIIDNASTDDTLARIASYHAPNLRIIANKKNVGVAAGNNQGIVAALADECDCILLINNDVEFPPGLFSGLESALNRHNCEMLVPKIYFHNPPETIWCAGGALSAARAGATIHFGEGEPDHGQHDTARPITYAPTCCMLIRKSVFDKIGLMDEKYFVYADDSDFCLRALRAKISFFYDPSVSLTHKVSSLTGGEQSPFGIRFGARNKTYFIRKNFPFPLSWWFLAAYQAYLAKRMLTRQDSFTTYRAKQRAIREGLAIPT